MAATRSLAELAPEAAPPTLMELLRWPGLVAGMLFYSLRDRLG